jgi:YfiH family protein
VSAPAAGAVPHGVSTEDARAERFAPIDDFADFGVRAFTTTRAAGSYSTAGDEPVGRVMDRWAELQRALDPAGERFATARQVHGSTVLLHAPGWRGWLRGPEADGHVALARGTGLAVTVADCVPVFVAHPSGAIALLHSGWRGTVANILARAVSLLAEQGRRAAELRVHLGPSICGGCYEVSPDVFGQLTGRSVDRPTTVDLRAVIADQARASGVGQVSTSAYCTRCDNARFFSHRAGDAGRQLGVMVALGSA